MKRLKSRFKTPRTPFGEKLTDMKKRKKNEQNLQKKLKIKKEKSFKKNQKKWKTEKNEKQKKLKKPAVFFCPSGWTTFHMSSVGWCCLVPPLGGVAAFPIFSCWWCCLPPPSVGWCCLVFLLWVVLPFFCPFGGAAFHLSSVGWCCLVSLFCWVVLLCLFAFLPLGGVAFPASHLLGGAAWFPSLLGRVAFPISFCVVLPSFSLLWVGLRSFPLFSWVVLLGPPDGVGLFFRGAAFLPLGGAAFFLSGFPSLGGVAVFFCPSGGTNFSPVFCWVVLLGPLSFQSHFRVGGAAWFAFPPSWAVLLFFLLLLRGAAFLPLLWVGCFFPSSVGLCPPLWAVGVVLLSFPSFGVGLRSPSLRLGGAAWSSSSFGWCCFSPLLCRGAAFLPLPPLGGAAFPQSSSGWSCFTSSLLNFGAAWFPSSPLGGDCFSTLRCCLPSPPLCSGAFSPLVLLGRAACFFQSHWVVLLGFLLLLLVGHCLPPPPVGGAAFFPSSGWVVLLGFLLLWAVLLFQSPFVCCCLRPPPWVGLRSPPLLLGGAAWSFPPPVAFPISFCCVVLLPFSPPGLLGSTPACCFPISIGAAFLLSFWVGLLSFPCLLLGGAASVHSSIGVVLRPALPTIAFLTPPWVELLFPIFFYVVVLPSFPFLLWVVLPSFPSFGWGCFPFPLLGWCCLVSFFFGWCCFSLSFGVVLPSFPSFGWWCVPPILLLFPIFCGAALVSLLWVVLLFPWWDFLPFWVGPPLWVELLFFIFWIGWCCLVSFFFGWCCFSTLRCCLPSPPLCSGAFSPLVCWVAQLGFPPLGGFAALSSPPFGGAAVPPPFLGGAVFSHLKGLLASFFCWVVLLSKIKKKRCKVKEIWKQWQSGKMKNEK